MVWPPVVASPPGPPLSASALRPSPAPRRVRLRGRALPPPGTPSRHTLPFGHPTLAPALFGKTKLNYHGIHASQATPCPAGGAFSLSHPQCLQQELTMHGPVCLASPVPRTTVGSPAPAVGRMGTIRIPVTVTRAHSPDLKPQPGHSHAAWTLSASVVLKLLGWIVQGSRWMARVHGAGLGPFPAP